MRHAVAGYKFSRDTEHRTAMFRNLAAAVIQHGQITTTIQKAKAVKPFVEKLITLARKGDLASRRRVLSLLPDRYLVNTVKGYEDDADVERDRHGKVVSAPRLIDRLFREVGPRYVDRPGGYTRIIRLAKHRIGDGGDLVVLQLVGNEQGPRHGRRQSRRRQIADHRTAYAAKLRKGAAPAAKPAPEQAAAEQTQGEQPAN